MPLKKVLGTIGSQAQAIKELQGLTQTIVSGDVVLTDISIPGIHKTDVIIGALNLTDLANLALIGEKALWTGEGDYDAELEIKAIGADGNNFTFTLVGDSPTEGGVTVNISLALKTIVAHYESGVSTVADVNTAIGALATYRDVVDVKTAGTLATVLTSPADNVLATPFTGGVDTTENELPMITSEGNIQFTHSDTSDKKLLITYYVTPSIDA